MQRYQIITTTLSIVTPIIVFFLLASNHSANDTTKQLKVANQTVQPDSIVKIFGDSLDAIMERVMIQEHLPGAGVVLVQNGQSVLKRGYGTANMYTGERVDPDKSIFRIGSISKALTLLALTKLIDDNLIQRSDPIEKYFPDLPKSEFNNQIIIEHLLTHTAGFDQDGRDRHVWDLHLPLYERAKKRMPLNLFLKRYLHQITRPGAYYRYDTYGTSLAGLIIGQVTGLNYQDAMQQVLFQPLGMTSSGVDQMLNGECQMAAGHGYNNNAYQVVPFEIYTTTPASSIDATVADMGKLLEALTGDGSNEHGRLFSKKMLSTVLQPQYRPRPDFAGTTHGLHESFQVGMGPEALMVRTIGHGGDMYGYKTFMRIIPSYKTAIFIAVNRNPESGGGPINIHRTIMKALLQVLGVPRLSVGFDIPKYDNQDLTEYAGEYYFGVYCHRCSDQDFEQGGWRPGWKHDVTVKDNTLIINGEPFLPAGDDLFVRADGYDRVFFGRNPSGNIEILKYQDENNTFEKK